MKKIIAILILALVCVAFAGAQGFTGEKAKKGGFNDGSKSSSTVITVEKALKMKDDTNAVLRGNIVKKVKHEKYLFKDAPLSSELS